MTVNQKIEEAPRRLPLDLQFFSSDHPFAAEDVTPEPHPFAAEPVDSPFAQFTDNPNPLMAPDTPQVQSPDQGQLEQPQSQEPQEQEEYLDFSGRKVKAYGEDVKGLHQDYTELNRTYQTTNQELQQARQLLSQYEQLVGQQGQNQAPQSNEAATHTQETTANVDPARMQQLNEEYMERMYENKFEADQWWAQQPEVQAMEQARIEQYVQARLQAELEPVQQEREIQNQVMYMRETYSDFDAYADKISELVAAQPHLAEVPNAIENLYLMAKGQTAPTPDALLQDPKFQEQIVQNEQIRNMILQNYQQVKTQSAPPGVMGRGASQTPTSLGDNKPKSIAEASAAFMRFMGQQ